MVFAPSTMANAVVKTPAGGNIAEANIIPAPTIPQRLFTCLLSLVPSQIAFDLLNVTLTLLEVFSE